MSVDIDRLNPSSKRGWVRIGYDRSLWIPRLPRLPAGYDLNSWAAGCARLWWDASGLPYGDSETTRLAAALSAIHENTYGRIPCHLVFIHLPDPRLTPLAAYLGLWEQEKDREDQLRSLTRADDTETVTPPIVDVFRTAKLGRGLRTLRYKQHPNGSLYAALRYAWRSEEHATDLQLWTSSGDLGRLQQAIDDIDEFARAIAAIPRSELRRG